MLLKILLSLLPKFYFSFGGGDDDGGGQAGQAPMPQIVMPPQYDFTEPRFRSMSNFVTSNIDNIIKGAFLCGCRTSYLRFARAW